MATTNSNGIVTVGGWGLLALAAVGVLHVARADG
jgi:hypothetical protein